MTDPGDLDQSINDIMKLAFRRRSPTESADPGSIATIPAPIPTEMLGDFELLRELGRGGMGVVYLAEDMRLHRKVAIKVLTAFAAQSRSLRTRLLREAEVASKLDHPAICKVFEVGEANGLPFIAMQYIEGNALAQQIADRRADATVAHGDSHFASATTRREDVMATVHLAEKVAQALHSAHQGGLVHRDVKPGNIMVTRSGEPVLLDFGLARDDETEGSELTQTGQIMGTPAYMAPEQLKGERSQVDRRADVYGLAVTLYECLTTRRPFEAPNREQLYSRILTSDPPDPRRLNPAIPKDLSVVLQTALEKDLNRRYQNAEDFAEDLRRVRELKPITARPISTVGHVTRWARRRPALATLVAVLLIAIPALAGLAGFVLANLTAIQDQSRLKVEARLERFLEEGFDELAHGSAERAIEAFDHALGMRENSVEAVGGKALTLLEAHRDQECMDLLEGRRELLASEPMLRQLRADAYQQLGREDTTNGEEYLPQTALDYFLAGSRLMQDCTTQYDPAVFKRAAAFFQRAIVNAKTARPLYHFQLAHVAAHLTYTNRYAADPADTEELCRMIADSLQKQWKESKDAWRWSATALVQVDDAAAVAACRHALKLDSNLPRVWNCLGGCLKRAGQYKEAIEAFKNAAKLSAQDPYRAARGHLALAELYCEVGKHRDIPKAIQILKDARDLQPVDSMVLAFLGRAYILGRRWDEAIDTYREIIKLAPEQAFAYSQLGSCLLRTGRFQESAAAYEKAIEIDKGHVEAVGCYRPYGQALMHAGRLAEAVVAFKKAKALRPRDGNIGFQLGLAHMKLGRWEDAASALEGAIQNGRRDPTAFCNLGLSLLQYGEFERAQKALQRGHDLSARVKGWRFPSGRWLRESEKMRELESRLEPVLQSEDNAPPPDDLRTLAKIAFIKKRFGASAGLYEEVFDLQPSLKDQQDILLAQTHRYAAACAAALAGFGKGIDTANFGDSHRSRWRQLAIECLHEDLAALQERYSPDSQQVSKRLAQALKSWKGGLLKVLRHAQVLAAKPEAESQAWTALWKTVDQRIQELE